MTMTVIEHIEVGSGGAASITFSDIPQEGFTDLYLVFSLRSNTTGNTELYLKLNSTNPTQRMLVSNYSAGTASSNTNAYITAPASYNTASTFGNGQIYIPNYTGTTQKSASVDNVTETNGTSYVQAMITAALYNVTTGVTSIDITDIYGNWVQYSSAALYGVLAGSDGITSVS